MLKTVIIFLLVLTRVAVMGQNSCPVNIGFEKGNFDNWECSEGTINGITGEIMVNYSQPVANRHTLLSNTLPTTFDYYGGFPVNCPNGSGFSIQLGNNGTGRQAERVSYTFTIPADDDNYSIIYNYAVVFQNPDHGSWEQPKFTANVVDVTTETYIGCSSFSFAASSSLPGFKESTVLDKVFYKEWTPVTIKLSGYAGKTIRLEFTTNDCTRGGHFGYAYVDVNENCASPISGNVFCVNDTSQTLVAPYGFGGYRWFPSDFSKVLGTGLVLNFNPIPAASTVFAVEVTPFPDQGCIDTVYTTIVSSPERLELKTPLKTVHSCISAGVDLTSGGLTSGSSPGLSFAYYTDPTLTSYVPAPKFITKSGTYYVKATNSVGCTAIKPIIIKIAEYPVLSIPTPPPVIRPSNIDLNTLLVNGPAGVEYTFWKDSIATIPLPNPEALSQTGRYFIKATNEGGCFVITPVNIKVNEPFVRPPNAFSPNGDGVNDLWQIPLIDLYPECVVEVFSRSGQLMFRSLGYANAWNGKLNGMDLPMATYYYIIKPAIGLPSISGSVSIIR